LYLIVSLILWFFWTKSNPSDLLITVLSDNLHLINVGIPVGLQVLYNYIT